MEKEKKRIVKVGGFIVGAVGFIASAIGIFIWVTGIPDLPGLFHAKPTSAYVYEVGQKVHFGQWDWRVLAVENGKVLLLAENVILKQPYNEDYTKVTWKNCTLRAYLNGEFLEEFSLQDRAKICITGNINRNNQWFGTNGGNSTTDKVFLLSIEEVVKYFGDSGQLKNKNPDNEYWIDDQYNSKRAAYLYNDDWWLRSPGYSQDAAAYVMPDGRIQLVGWLVSETTGGVRPALWLKID